MKKKYYVNIANGAITDRKENNLGAFAIYADDGDLNRIKERLGNMHEASLDSYVKSHIPYYPEINNRENAAYDGNLKELYRLLHELGDEEAKQHIDSIHILDNPGNNLV